MAKRSQTTAQSKSDLETELAERQGHVEALKRDRERLQGKLEELEAQLKGRKSRRVKRRISDAWLVKAWISGQEWARQQLRDRYEPWIHGVATSYEMSDAEASEVADAVFAILAENRAELSELTGDLIGAWLVNVTHRYCRRAKGLTDVTSDDIAQIFEERMRAAREESLRSEGAVWQYGADTQEETIAEESESAEQGVREQFADATLGELVNAFVPSISDEAIRRLEELIAAAQENPPEDRESFARDVNRLLDAHSLRLRIGDSDLGRLCVQPGASGRGYLAIAKSGGGAKGFKRAGRIAVVPVPPDFARTGLRDQTPHP